MAAVSAISARADSIRRRSSLLGLSDERLAFSLAVMVPEPVTDSGRTASIRRRSSLLGLLEEWFDLALTDMVPSVVVVVRRTDSIRRRSPRFGVSEAEFMVEARAKPDLVLLGRLMTVGTGVTVDVVAVVIGKDKAEMRLSVFCMVKS